MAFVERERFICLLNEVETGKIQQPQINYLIESVYKISLEYLKHNKYKIGNILNEGMLSLEDIAIEAIIPIFSRNKKGRFNNLIVQFKNWKPAITNEEEAIYFLNKLTAYRVEQHISFLLKESDPFFSKILDSVNYFLKKEGYKKINHLGTVYITYKSENELCSDLIEADELKEFPAYIFSDHKNLFTNLFSYIKNKTNYFPAVPLNALVQKIKKVNADAFLMDQNINCNNYKKLEVKEIIEYGLLQTYEKLENSYLEKGKLSEDEIIKFKNTLSDLAMDLQNGGVNPGLYEYLSTHMNNLCREHYEKNYHNILEYLFRILKLSIAEKLQVNS